jgi:colicin import membrane protein
MPLLDHLRQPGMPLSVGLHAGLLVAALVSFSLAKPLPEAIEAVAVEVVDESMLREVTRGEQSAKQAAPTQRVDRVSDKVEQNAPGVAAKQIHTDKTPAKQEATAREERKEIAAVPPPVPVVPPRAAEPAKPIPAPVRAPQPAKEAEEEEEAEEAIRQKQIKRPEPPKAEPPKPDQAALAKLLEQQKRDEQKKIDDAKARDDQRKQAEAKAAEDRKKAEDQKKAQEAAKKAADDKRKREAEQEARNQQALDAARRALLSSREAPQNSGNTGQVVSRTPAAGAPTATGQRLNPSDRAALVGLLADQIRACWNIPVSARPNPLPQVRVALNADGTLGATPALINSSGDPAFRPLADSGMRAIRQCSPFRIPARFAPTYNDWRSIVVQLDPES